MAATDAIFFLSFLFFLWFFCSFLVKSIRSHRNGGTKALNPPPSPPAIPFIGHLHLLGSVLAKSLHSLADKYGPFIQLRMGASECYVVSDANLAKEVLKTNELNFVSRLEFDTSDYNIYRGSGFITAPYNAYWRFMKKLCMTRLLSTTQLNQLVHIREQEMEKLVESLVETSKKGESCELKQALMTMTNNVICRMAMNTRCMGTENEARDIKKFVNQIVALGGKLSMGNVLGPLAKLDLFGHGRQLEKVLRKFDGLVEKIIKEHEEKQMNGAGSSLEGRDLMDILLEISQDPNAEMKLTKKEIKAFFLDVIIAGTDTSALTSQWILAELINHRRVFSKLREEINSVAGPNRLVKESDLPNLPYLQAVVKEALRLHPPSPIVLRECIEDCKINGYDLKGKTRMIVNVYTIQRDPSLWTDPEEFIPERFMVDSDKNPEQRQLDIRGQNFSYLPFGTGRRACPGSSLAYTVVQFTIATLVQCFDWEVKGGEKINMDEGSGFSMGMAHQLESYPITHFNPFSSNSKMA
ncbi:hypothetical protein Tsubulata_027572 [Turnera subulata]|uniref:Uncharacterized protein n=1 Tax=Turnera subulata TaxID=218843 RepID=A0A9Q0FE64_9ROSI|nr:hypothetical protein Tsubulata_027572 [Turnera subulata]